LLTARNSITFFASRAPQALPRASADPSVSQTSFGAACQVGLRRIAVERRSE
jgi:hypothetical protein